MLARWYLCGGQKKELNVMKTSFRIAVAAISTLAMAGGLAAYADQHKGKRHGEQRFEAMDTDGDGAVSRAEVDAVRAERFAAADANRDGGVSFEEAKAYQEAERERRREEKARKHFAAMDADGDGVLKPEEFGNARIDAMFERVDEDGDGVITQAERDEMRDTMRERRGKRHDKRKPSED